ncbi:isoprenoid synthase domain-containing protein [Boletus edulis BED1]|uniref:Terpene synthase n=1 Tax=Boletus edulis BED1 TaxID=1328754 RepID=A0AAD4BK49_BOLED|nr:isoprenoid synthase domain-containing protein [Boletus edulis BED1]
MSAKDQCAVGPDGQLLDASQIQCFHDLDDEIPLLPVPSTSLKLWIPPAGRAVTTAGSCQVGHRVSKPSFCLTNSNNAATSLRISSSNEPVAHQGSILDKNTNKHGRPTRRVFIPNVLGRWPWPHRINPNYAAVRKEADAWVTNFHAFSPKAQDAYNRCDFNLLACLAYPIASKEHVRAGCDLMHLTFLFDEYSDRSTPSEVRQKKDVVMDALRNPHMPRPEREWIGGEIARQFWERTIPNTTVVVQKRFIQSMDEYLEGVVQESIDKKDRRILDIKSYIDARRRTSGVKPSFSIIELGLDIPDDVMAHPAVQEMILAAVDIIAFCNDIYSYNMERFRGDDLHNMITCVMNEYDTDVNGAMLWMEDFLVGVADRFQAAMAALPQWEEPLNSQVRTYCDGLGQWVRALDDWSFESERYFGNKGLEIKENRWISLLPKKCATEIGPVHLDSSLL